MRALFCVILGLSITGLAGAVLGQEVNYSADRKITGNYYRPHTARSYHRSAVEHARVLSHYATTYKAVPQETAQEHAAAIRQNLEAAKTEFAKLSEAAKKDKTIAKHLAAIQAHQTKASEMCDMLEGECAKPDANGLVKISDCCGNMYQELQAAEAEHEKLMKYLKVEKLGEPKK